MTFVLGDDRDNDYSIPFSLNSRVTKKQSLKLVVKHTYIYMYTYSDIHTYHYIYTNIYIHCRHGLSKRMGVLKELIIHNHKEKYKLLRCIESCHFQIS